MWLIMQQEKPEDFVIATGVQHTVRDFTEKAFAANELIDFVDYDDLFNKYDTLNKISFDYAVVEHETEIEVIAPVTQRIHAGLSCE